MLGVMETPRQIVKAIVGWLFLAGASYMLGATLSGIASMVGITDFPNDHRGEWSLLTMPVSAILSIAIGYFSIRSLLRQRFSLPVISIISGALTALSAIFVTSVFASAA
jgi:uncharacterized membrane protein HdeD (DUF308 family)